MFERRQVGIEKRKGVGRFDYPDTGSALLFHDLVAERLHTRPMYFRTEMMLRVVAVKKPDPIVKFLVTAHAPGKRFVRVAAIVPVVPVQVRKAMAKVPEGNEETDVTPVKDAENDECGHEQR